MKITLLFLILIFSGILNAQDSQPLYRQFFFNPYTFNPAFAGLSEQPEIGIMYRKQWVNFQDAPSTAGLTLQLPASRRVVVGFNVLTDKQVLLKHSSFMTSFIYLVPLGFQQSLRFGMSGGIGMNSLNLSSEEMDTNDPVITRAAGNNYYVKGNFGVVYMHRKLKLGFALTDLFNTNPFTPEKFNEFSFSNLRNRLYSVSYRFDLATAPTDVAVEPYLLYHESEDGLQNYWSATTLVHFNQVLWTGAGYSQYAGLSLILGFEVKEKLRFSYHYEFPPFKSSTSSNTSHELQLSLKFGRKRPSATRVSPILEKYNSRKPGKARKRGY